MPRPRNPKGKEIARLDLRLWDAEERAILDEAAELAGDKYTTEWARRVLIVEARRILAAHRKRQQ